MARRDSYHEIVRHALEADGWIITHDPLKMKYGDQTVYVDFGAEGPIAAEKAGAKIAVEVKTFLSPSPITDMERAIGQYGLYNFLLRRDEPERRLYLALSEAAFERVFNTADGRDLAASLGIKLIVIAIGEEKIQKWVE